jgi:hypothetical protein
MDPLRINDKGLRRLRTGVAAAASLSSVQGLGRHPDGGHAHEQLDGRESQHQDVQPHHRAVDAAGGEGHGQADDRP